MILSPDGEVLEHFGVQGMKWGVRRDRRANTLAKVGRGQGSLGERVRAAGTVSLLDVARGRGFRGAARVRGERQLNRNARIRAGEASARDKIAFYGGWKLQDIFPTGKASTNTKAAIGASLAGAMVLSIGHNVLRRAASA